MSPHLHSMPESPYVRRRRQTQSAKPWDGDKLERRGALGVEQKEATSKTLRAPSAPSGERLNSDDVDDDDYDKDDDDNDGNNDEDGVRSIRCAVMGLEPRY